MIEHLKHRPRLPLAGKIKLGIVVENEKGVKFPKDLNYFVMPPELIARDPEHFEKPQSLDVMFHANEVEDVFDAYYEKYAGRAGGAGGLLSLRCDGQTFTSIPTNVNDPVRTGRCLRPQAEVGKPWPICECGATPKGKLLVLLIHAPVGVYRLTLGGHQQIQQLYEDIRMRRAEFGRLSGIPFRLVRRPETTSVPDKHGQRIPKVGHPVRLDSTFTLYQALTSRGVDPYQLAEQAQRALPGPIPDEPDLVDDDVDDDADGAATTAHRDPNEVERTAPSPSAEKTVAGPRTDDAETERRDEVGEAMRTAPPGRAESGMGRVQKDAGQQEAPIEDDESMAFAFADALGIAEDDYRLYATAKHRAGMPGPLAPGDVATECAMFRAATTDEQKAELLRRITVKVASLRAAAPKNG